MKKHNWLGDVAFGAAIILVLAMGLILILRMQDTEGVRHYESYPTPSPEPEDDDPIEVVLISGIPTAVFKDPTPSPTCTPTQTPTVSPTCTEKPVERISTPTPTNTPTPTKKPTEKPVRVSGDYSAGKEGTYKAEVNGTHSWKPYARYTAIKNKSSMQYKLQQVAKTDDHGRRYVTVDGVKRFCVALGTAWAGGSPSDIGRCVDLVMVNGATLHCVLGDVKRPEKSKGGEGKYGSGNELAEFQVDEDKLPYKVRGNGDCSYFGSDWEGEVKAVIVYDHWVSGFGKE